MSTPQHSPAIDRLRIATPCPISWDEMRGDNRIRFCGHCRLNVYNISELSRIEAEKLIGSTEGRLCARLFRRADGTILTKDCPVGLRALRRRVTKRAAAVFAAIVSLSAAAIGQQPSGKDGQASGATQSRITRTDSPSDHADAVLSGTVVDRAGSRIPGATVTLTNAHTKDTKTALANDQGRFEFKSLAPGDYSITVAAAAFKSHQWAQVIVEKSKLINLDTVLEIAGEHLIGVLGMDEPVDTIPGTTIINVDIIRKLPVP